MTPLIPFDEIDARLDAIGKNRAWLASASGRKPDSIRVALAPSAPASKRSELLQRALTDAILKEEEERSKVESSLPVGFSTIFLDDLQLDRADRASREIRSNSLLEFCTEAIMFRANEILAGNVDPLKVRQPLALVPDLQPAAKDSDIYKGFKLDLVGGVAAGAQILSDGEEEVLQVERNYGKNHYALRVFGRSMEPQIPDGSIVVVKRLPESTKPRKGTIVVYADGHGLSLKVFDYRVAKDGEEADAFGKVPVLSSLNPEFPEIQLMESGRLEAVFVEVLPEDH